MLNKKVYETLKWVALIVLPGLATLVGTVGNEWGMTHVKAIVATITAVSLFFGLLVKTMPPFDGTAYIEPGELDEPGKFNIDLRGFLEDPAELENHKTIRLKVRKPRS